MFVWLLKALKLPSGLGATLRFSSFYFTDPPALRAGTWPKQLHSNNLEHLSLARQVNANYLKMSRCVCVRLLFQEASTCSLTFK